MGGAVYIINGIKDGNEEHLYSDCSVGGVTATFRRNMPPPSSTLKELGRSERWS